MYLCVITVTNRAIYTLTFDIAILNKRNAIFSQYNPVKTKGSILWHIFFTHNPKLQFL